VNIIFCQSDAGFFLPKACDEPSCGRHDFEHNPATRMSPWLLWTVAALLSWGVWAVLAKLLGDALSAEQSQALSTLGLLPILAPLGWKARATLTSASRKGLALAFVGGAITCLGNIAYYAAIARGEKVATVASITAIAPLVTVLLALALLKERINRVQQIGIVLSLVAIWLFNIQSERGLLSSTVWFAAPPILLWGASGFLQKVATNHLSGDTAALVYLAAFVPVGIYYGLRSPWPEVIAPRTWTIVAALGFFIAFGNFAVLAAYARGGQASVIAPLSNLYPLISVPIAVLLFHERIGGREMAAIGAALASVAALSWESRPSKT
jgi:drug/metabolite transporter (DMT)-like permease